jgi:hypothetical protein
LFFDWTAAVYSIVLLYDKDIKGRKALRSQLFAFPFSMPAHGIYLYNLVHGAALSAPAWKNIK